MISFCGEDNRIMGNGKHLKKIIVNLLRTNENMNLEIKRAHVLGKYCDGIY